MLKDHNLELVDQLRIGLRKQVQMLQEHLQVICPLKNGQLVHLEEVLQMKGLQKIGQHIHQEQ